MAARRYSHEPAYVLHHYDWSESSLILEVFTRQYGRVALVAKGAKRPSSNFRPVLLPLQPLRLNYTLEGDIGTLKGAEWSGGHVMPTGEALLSGYYLNELMLRMLGRDDAHPALFEQYAVVVALLATPEAKQSDFLQAILRAFELALLRALGVLPQCDVQTLTYQPMQPQAHYLLVPEVGWRLAQEHELPYALRGSQCVALQAALDDASPMQATLRLCVQQRAIAQALKHQLRAVVHYHCGTSMLRTRQMMMELQQL